MYIITMCGSMKKLKLMNLIEKKLMSKMDDIIIFTPSCNNYILNNDKDQLETRELINLKNKHKFLMKRSDFILLVDYDMGTDTHEEILYAEDNNIPIIRLSEIIKYFKNDEEIMKELMG